MVELLRPAVVVVVVVVVNSSTLLYVAMRSCAASGTQAVSRRDQASRRREICAPWEGH
jgi:hypothetical protein